MIAFCLINAIAEGYVIHQHLGVGLCPCGGKCSSLERGVVFSKYMVNVVRIGYV